MSAYHDGSGWTIETLRIHLEALREADQRALTIKESADETARGLAREDQKYKDEQANKLREQIASERNLYVRNEELAALAARMEALIKPLSDFMAAQSGKTQGVGNLGNVLIGVAALVIAVVAVLVRK